MIYKKKLKAFHGIFTHELKILNLFGLINGLKKLKRLEMLETIINQKNVYNKDKETYDIKVDLYLNQRKNKKNFLDRYRVSGFF